MSTLSTHVLDTMHGKPAAGLALRLTDAAGALLFSGHTNADGRCPELPSPGAGQYCLHFEVAAYFRAAGVTLPDPPFLDVVPVAFGMTDAGHYHVPLLVSPFSYSSYRGS